MARISRRGSGDKTQPKHLASETVAAQRLPDEEDDEGDDYGPRPERIITIDEYRAIHVWGAALVQQLQVQRDQRLLKQATSHFLFCIVYAVGLSAFEASALNWEDVDFSNGRLRVRGKKGHVRSVAIGDEAVAAFRRLRELQEEWMAWHRPRAGEPLPVFVSEKNRRRLGRKGMFQKFRAAAIAVGVRPTLSFRSLRHGAAVRLLAEGKSIETVRELLGYQYVADAAVFESFVDFVVGGAIPERRPKAG